MGYTYFVMMREGGAGLLNSVVAVGEGGLVVLVKVEMEEGWSTGCMR